MSYGVRSGLAALILGCGATLVATPCDADTVTLKNGREIHGRLVEEQIESIRIRTSGGTITISKTEVATFSENESWEVYEKPRSIAELEDEKRRLAEAEGGTKPGDDGRGPPPPRGDKGDKPAKRAKGDAEAWEWADSVKEEDIERLTEIRDALLADLAKLGPTPEERLAKYALSPEEAASLKMEMKRFPVRRTGNPIAIRNKVLADIVDTFGLKAVEKFAYALESDNGWTARLCAKGMGQLISKGEEGEAKWLMYHYKVPGKLVAMLEAQGDPNSAQMRKAAGDALLAITNKTPAAEWTWPDGEEMKSMRNAAETTAARKWAAWWKSFEVWWVKQEEEKEAQRIALAESLEKLKTGEVPEGYGTDGADEEEDDF